MELTDGTIHLEASAHLAGTVRPPGDKSISHRALILSALAEGTSTIQGLSTGDDVACTKMIVERLGAQIDAQADHLEIRGGRSLLRSCPDVLDCGNSGTALRLLIGATATIPGRHLLDGDASLSRRPMDRVAQPLRQMGARVEGRGATELPPIVVDASQLHGIDYHLPMASAQVKSAILLAGLVAEGETVVRETTRTRPHTEEMLAMAGARIAVAHEESETVVRLMAGDISPVNWIVAADPSNAAFFIVGGLLAGSGTVRCRDLYGGMTRRGFASVLARMGGDIHVEGTNDELLDLSSSPSSLEATTIDASEIPSLDEVPILTVAASAAVGVTRFVGVGELRLKESDRFAACLNLAKALGAQSHGEDDDLVIGGLGSPDRFAPFSFDAQGDHRLAMAAAIAATVGNGGSITGTASVSTNYPGFFDDLARIADR
jgi:3-phosphoshikimate 1-carboxyvinyltransferase